jgi:pimeloyl-ACP methyl ester carboxylesterase
MNNRRRIPHSFELSLPGGGRMTGLQAGQGAPDILFVHGWAGHAEFWRPQLTHFMQRYRVVAPNLPGHGGSDAPRAGANIDDFAEDINSVARALAMSRCVLVGHSMGGAVALEAARRLGDRVAGVVMVDAFTMDWGRLDPALVEGFLDSFRHDLPAAMRGLIEQGCPGETDTALIDRLAAVMTAIPPAVAVPMLESLLHWNPTPALRTLTAPVHCINGALADRAVMSRYAPFVTEHIVTGAGHYPQMADPTAFNHLLDAVLEEITGP